MGSHCTHSCRPRDYHFVFDRKRTAYHGGMQFDMAPCKMAYEAARDNFVRFYRDTRMARAPRDFSEPFHEAYLRGHERGLNDGIQFDPIASDAVPPEFDLAFASAWRRGYEDGNLTGAIYRSILLKKMA
jgi:hypothetical protein